MIIKVWSNDDKIKQKLSVEKIPTYTIEIPDNEINTFIDKFGQVFSEALVEGLERQRIEAILKKSTGRRI